MTRSTKRVRRAVKIIGNPHPTFVSLVNHGANQTPFKAVKIADFTEVSQKESDMKNTQTEEVTKSESGDVEIHKIVFSGKKFTSEDNVKTYMDSKGYSNYAVEKVDDDFVVNAIDESAFEDIKPLPVDDGVTQFVGKLLDPATKADRISVSVRVNNDEKDEDKKGAQGTEAKGEEEITARPRSRDMILFPAEKAEDRGATGSGDAGDQAAVGGEESALQGGKDAVETAQAGGKGPAEETQQGTPVGDPSADEAKPAAAAPAAETTQKETEKPTPDTGDEDQGAIPTKGKKVDSYRAYYSEATSIAEVLKDAEDGIPVGFCDVNVAFMGALKNLVKAGKSDQISTLCAEFGTLLTQLASLTASLEAKGEREAAIERLFGSKKEVPSSDVTTTKQSASPGEKVVKAIETLKADEPAIAKAVAPLIALMTDVLKTVKDSTAKTTEEVSKVANRVVKLEKVRQVRNSAPVDDVTTSGGKEKKEEKPQPVSKATANLFGFDPLVRKSEHVRHDIL